jgi:hypothetical protein
VFFWFFVVRMLFWRWGGPWRHGYYGSWHRGYGPPRGFRGRGRGRWDRHAWDDPDDRDDRGRPRHML